MCWTYGLRYWTQGSRISLLTGSRLYLPDEKRVVKIDKWVDVGVEERGRYYQKSKFPYGKGLVPMVVSLQQEATSKDHAPLPVGKAVLVLSPFLAHRAPRSF